MLSEAMSGMHSATVTEASKDVIYPVYFDGGEGSARLSSSGIEITTQASGLVAGMTMRVHVLLRQMHVPVVMHICVAEVETRAGAFLVQARILRVLVENKSVGPRRLQIARYTGL